MVLLSGTAWVNHVYPIKTRLKTESPPPEIRTVKGESRDSPFAILLKKELAVTKSLNESRI